MWEFAVTCKLNALNTEDQKHKTCGSENSKIQQPTPITTYLVIKKGQVCF